MIDSLLPLLLLAQMIYLMTPPITSHHEVPRGDWDLKIATNNGLAGVLIHEPIAVQKRSAVAGRDRRVELYIEACGKYEHLACCVVMMCLIQIPYVESFSITIVRSFLFR